MLPRPILPRRFLLNTIASLLVTVHGFRVGRFKGSEVHGSRFTVQRFRVQPKSEPGTHNGKRMRIERFEDIDPPAVWRIEAWQLARELTGKVYGLTKKTKFARD